ncbi:uncharacterized protein B0J16DRAFT_389709 [Fusarium flagelliforme]|uniref:uncharacterized protein n=1 Tax=Fusarium flagelliforme TaxID=2675880 RepID=UPI001E8D6414|nr:uncharacterized protein B0J16DRAFT_389709 [Fusarium flagelliforme]KAH7173824.1 hypothetical protein B0J16DRAFT_389709 [Fusarium flagelliforme]
MSARPSATDDKNITKICKDGDTLLEVGPKGELIQVSSDFLERISTLFDMMINNTMANGKSARTDREPGSPILLDLSGECPKTVKHVLRILYGADDDFKSIPSFETVCAMVAFADYYYMEDRLKFWAAEWLRISPFNEDDGPDIRECFEKMVVAYMLRDEHSFFETSHYIATYGGGIIQWGLDLPEKENLDDDKKFPDKELGIKLALAIEEMRPVPKRRAPRGKGLCIDCFDNAEGSFLSKQNGCDNDMYHCIEEDDQLEL